MKYVYDGFSGSVFIGAGEITGHSLPAEISAVTARRLSGSQRARVAERLEGDIDCGGLRFRIYGSADAVLYPCEGENSLPVLFEFVAGASKAGPPSGRALVLAYLLSLKNSGCDICIRTVAAHEDYSSVFASAEKKLTFVSLSGTVKGLLAPHISAGAFEKERYEEVLPSLKSLKFPFSSLRDGQKTLIDETYTALKRGEKLFARAPTGIGKTVSVLYGALRALEAKGFRRIFYLTAKASTGREAFAAAGKLFAAGALCRTAVLAAKEQICPEACGGGEKRSFVCDPKSCPLMKNYEAAKNDAIAFMLSKWRGYSVGAISSVAARFGICPYELSLDLAERCDIVICDYNYAFSPAVRLRRFFETDSEDGFVFLIDEAHNLPERARDIFSATLSEGCTAEARASVPEGSDIAYELDGLERVLKSCAGLCSDTSVKDDEGLESGYYFSSSRIQQADDAVSVLCDSLKTRLITVRRSNPEAAAAISPLLRKCSSWMNAAKAYGPEYRTYISLDKGRTSAELFCLDPSARLGEITEKAYATVFFSATLTPSDYYSDILSGGNGYGISLPSPFPRENLYVAAFTSADTRWEARDASVKKITAVIASVCSAKAGNYLVFFPSYKYLSAVADCFTEKYPKVRVKIQKPGMSRSDREDFIGFFADDGGVLRVGFCVLGGSFSEGIDLPGKRLIGTVIIGTGLPGLSAERNIIKEYYDVKSENGYDYAYVYPGMNNVLQAAGRVIRRDTDRGCVILVDPRYSEERYRQLMPPGWSNMKYLSETALLRDELRTFWGK
ncbi:MAG: ATP-dependent DNA helicase [Clostridia bacterium]|nr:ATP-dependent DNA helicase [Clostridia bacterium]